MTYLFWRMCFASEHSTPGFKRLLWVFWLLQDLHNWGCSTNQYALMVLKFWTFEGPLPCELEVGTVDNVLWYLKQEKRNMLHGDIKKNQEVHYWIVSLEQTWSLSFTACLAIAGHGKPMDRQNTTRVQTAISSLSFSFRNPFLVDHYTSNTQDIPNHHTTRNLVNLSRGSCTSN